MRGEPKKRRLTIEDIGTPALAPHMLMSRAPFVGAGRSATAGESSSSGTPRGSRSSDTAGTHTYSGHEVLYHVLYYLILEEFAVY